jgi:hypothetical protein
MTIIKWGQFQVRSLGAEIHVVVFRGIKGEETDIATLNKATIAQAMANALNESLLSKKRASDNQP